MSYPLIFTGQSGRKDIRGNRFGRLLVKEYSYTKDRRAMWLCVCDCGNSKVIYGKCLRNGSTKSCGCLQREKASEANSTHGLSKTRLHAIWCAMKGRTSNPFHSRYQYYGERGIKVCLEWATNFSVFREWAITNGYKSHLTIERLNVNGDYEPANCTWITIEEQQRNKRNNLKYRV